MKWIALLFLIFVSSTFADDACKNIRSDFKINDFFAIDYSRDLYGIQLSANNDEQINNRIIKDENGFISKSEFEVFFDNIGTGKVKGSYDFSSSILYFEVFPDSLLEKNNYCIYLKSRARKLLASFPFKVTQRMKEGGKQPLINEIHPMGGVIGDTLSIVGRGFGNDIDKIRITILKEDKAYAFEDKEICSLNPFYLTKEIESVDQSMKFTLSHYLKDNCDLDYSKYTFVETIFGKDIQIKLNINARPSNVERIKLLKPGWKFFTGGFSILITLLFLGLIVFISKKWNFVSYTILDPITNAYSLVKLQSFMWTVIIIGSYFYLAVSHGILLASKELPAINFSLIALLGVSYTGFLASSFVDNKKTKRIIKKIKPELKDLIFETPENIDISKLQLLGFNAICIIIYLYYLSKANILEGLPSIPEALHTLLLTSQGGYVGTQAIMNQKSLEEKEEENNIDKPNRKSETTSKARKQNV